MLFSRGKTNILRTSTARKFNAIDIFKSSRRGMFFLDIKKKARFLENLWKL